MIPAKRIESKLHSSLISNDLEKEVIDKLNWYRTELMKTKRELLEVKKQLADVHSHNDWVRYPQMGAF